MLVSLIFLYQPPFLTFVQVYHEVVRDDSDAGAVTFLLVSRVRNARGLNSAHARWTPRAKALKRAAAAQQNNNHSDVTSASDLVLPRFHEFASYHEASCRPLERGLYLGYVRLKSSMDQIRVLVPREAPNTIPHVRVRSAPTVSREEWSWLRALSRGEARAPPTHAQAAFHASLSAASSDLLASLGVSEAASADHRLHDVAVIELSDDVAFLLLLPPADGVCSLQDPDELLGSQSLTTLPVQAFEMGEITNRIFYLLINIIGVVEGRLLVCPIHDPHPWF